METMSFSEILGALALIIGGVVGGFTSAKKFFGGPAVAGLVKSQLEEMSRYRHPVVVIAEDLARAAGLRAILVGRGYREVSIARAAEYRHKAGTALVIEATEGIDLALVTSVVGAAEGLIYTTGRVQPPQGNWTMANSPVTLFARTGELVEWLKAAA